MALTELAGEVHEGLLALAVGAGLQVRAAMMEADMTAALCAVGSPHAQDRGATRHGHAAGSVTLGERRIPVTRPRYAPRTARSEFAVPAYELFSDTEVLGRMAMKRILAGLSALHYRVGLEPVGRAPSKPPPPPKQYSLVLTGPPPRNLRSSGRSSPSRPRRTGARARTGRSLIHHPSKPSSMSISSLISCLFRRPPTNRGS